MDAYLHGIVSHKVTASKERDMIKVLTSLSNWEEKKKKNHIRCAWQETRSWHLKWGDGNLLYLKRKEVFFPEQEKPNFNFWSQYQQEVLDHAVSQHLVGPLIFHTNIKWEKNPRDYQQHQLRNLTINNKTNIFMVSLLLIYFTGFHQYSHAVTAEIKICRQTLKTKG